MAVERVNRREIPQFVRSDQSSDVCLAWRRCRGEIARPGESDSPLRNRRSTAEGAQRWRSIRRFHRPKLRRCRVAIRRRGPFEPPAPPLPTAEPSRPPSAVEPAEPPVDDDHARAVPGQRFQLAATPRRSTSRTSARPPAALPASSGTRLTYPIPSERPPPSPTPPSSGLRPRTAVAPQP